MPITCFIRYEIDPFQKAKITTYAENWGRIIPRPLLLWAPVEFAAFSQRFISQISL